LSNMSGVAEGVTTTLVARNLAQKLGLEMPITERIHQVLYEDGDPKEVAAEMMGANVRHELSGKRWRLFSLFQRKKRTPESK